MHVQGQMARARGHGVSENALSGVLGCGPLSRRAGKSLVSGVAKRALLLEGRRGLWAPRVIVAGGAAALPVSFRASL